MNIYEQTEDILVLGREVTTFPSGIKEAFGALMKTLGSDRDYYGISWMDEGDKIKYYAMAREVLPGEAKSKNFEQLVIGKGNYRAEVLHDWMDQTECIKDIFHRLMENGKPNKDRPCIEWYQSNEDMFCMIRD
jgi:hypothetical protein